MEEQEIRALLAENIKKYRNKRGWSQLYLAEKLDISANFLSEIETGKGWVSPLTLSKLTNALEIEVFELFKPLTADDTTQAETRKMKRFAKDLKLALGISADKAANDLKSTVEKVCREYLG
ncbi:MAG: helix-turn-helix domain-containing protein [Treponema sp.]|jgi:transcriptional regulator with XRE-family HTH domain|nr:helix-turn-helix domain-containing protein [Treponema sp.]